MSTFDLIRKLHNLEERVTKLEEAQRMPSGTTREVLAEKYQAKFGKRPHHFMSEERIMEALSIEAR